MVDCRRKRCVPLKAAGMRENLVLGSQAEGFPLFGSAAAGGLAVTQQELTPCEQGRRRESSFLPRFFWISFVKGDFEKRIFQFRVRASVRPSRSP